MHEFQGRLENLILQRKACFVIRNNLRKQLTSSLSGLGGPLQNILIKQSSQDWKHKQKMKLKEIKLLENYKTKEDSGFLIFVITSSTA